MLFVRVKKTEQLENLKYDVDGLLEKDDIQVYDHRFIPHLTLFRLPKNKASKDYDVIKLTESTRIPQLDSFTVSNVFFKEACDNFKQKQNER